MLHSIWSRSCWTSLIQSICRTVDFCLYCSARWKNAKEDNQFPMNTLAKTLQDYQVALLLGSDSEDPAKCDKITQINTQIDETKEVLVFCR